tara:strand:+ start:74 stop:589 length:516 start_codon:yes stop_codon:yes gene_type:complete
MKTFKEFQEGVMAIPAAVAAGKYVVPALMTGIGAAGTIMQLNKGEKELAKKVRKNIMQDKGRKYVKPGEREDIDGEIADLRKNPKSRKISTRRQVENEINKRLQKTTDAIDLVGTEADTATRQKYFRGLNKKQGRITGKGDANRQMSNPPSGMGNLTRIQAKILQKKANKK